MRSVQALAAINVKDPLHVGLHAGAGIDGARFELDLGRKRVVLDLFIALESDLGDDGVLDHDDDDCPALAPDANILE